MIIASCGGGSAHYHGLLQIYHSQIFMKIHKFISDLKNTLQQAIKHPQKDDITNILALAH